MFLDLQGSFHMYALHADGTNQVFMNFVRPPNLKCHWRLINIKLLNLELLLPGYYLRLGNNNFVNLIQHHTVPFQ
jgi:hypothetical protein